MLMVRYKGVYWTCPYCGSNLDPGERCECGRAARIHLLRRRMGKGVTVWR